MGPINIPQMPQPKQKRPWRWPLLCSLLAFAGGIASGPKLIDQAYVLVEDGASFLGTNAPWLMAWLNPAAGAVARGPAQEKAGAPDPVPTPAPVPAPAPARAPAPEVAGGEAKAPTREGRGESPRVVALPVPAPAEKKAGMEQAAAVAPRGSSVARRAAAEAPARAERAAVEPPVVSPQREHGKGVVKAVASASAHTKKTSNGEDPFASDSDGANVAKAVAPSGKSKPAPSAKSEPAPKPMAAKSNDPLDSLMADGVADSKGKKSKDLDALLKDVQKSKPEPPPKREPPPPPSALSPADISRVMAGVKTRGNACAQRLGQSGNAELKITVGKDGRVTAVNVGGKMADTPLGACIEKATRAATFPASSGLKFDYRIDVR